MLLILLFLEQQGKVDHEVFRKAAKAGFYCRFAIPKEYGGLGLQDDFLYSVIVNEELERADLGSVTFSLGVNIVLPYFSKTSTEAQKARWLPKIANGAVIAVAMSEPTAGSDLAGLKTVREPHSHASSCHFPSHTPLSCVFFFFPHVYSFHPSFLPSSGRPHSDRRL